MVMMATFFHEVCFICRFGGLKRNILIEAICRNMVGILEFYPIWNYFPQGSVDCKPYFSGSIHISMPLLNCHGHWPIGASWKTGFVWRSQIFEASCGYSHEERPLCEPWQLTFHKACLHILAVMVAGPLLLGGI